MQKVIVRLPSEILSKGRKLPEGTERTWKGKDYVKKNGKWIPKKGESSKAAAPLISRAVSKQGKSVDTITSDAMQHYAKVHRQYKPGNTLGQEGTVSGSFFRSKEGKAALKHLKAKGLIEPHTNLNERQEKEGPDAERNYYTVSKKGQKLFDAARDKLKENEVVGTPYDPKEIQKRIKSMFKKMAAYYEADDEETADTHRRAAYDLVRSVGGVARNYDFREDEKYNSMRAKYKQKGYHVFDDPSAEGTDSYAFIALPKTKQGKPVAKKEAGGNDKKASKASKLDDLSPEKMDEMIARYDRAQETMDGEDTELEEYLWDLPPKIKKALISKLKDMGITKGVKAFAEEFSDPDVNDIHDWKELLTNSKHLKRQYNDFRNDTAW